MDTDWQGLNTDLGNIFKKDAENRQKNAKRACKTSAQDENHDTTHVGIGQ